MDVLPDSVAELWESYCVNPNGKTWREFTAALPDDGASHVWQSGGYQITAKPDLHPHILMPSRLISVTSVDPAGL